MERGADKQTITYISVSSVNGTVTLTGEVRGNKAKTKAGDIRVAATGVYRISLSSGPTSNEAPRPWKRI